MRENETKLLNLAKSKDTGAVEQILAKYKHLVVAVARKYFLIGGDKEDLIQEGMIGLYKAISVYDSFSGYAVMLIEREIISAIRTANTGNQQALNEGIFIDNDDELGDSACPESDFINEESTLELTNEIKDKLSGFEKVVVDYYLKGYTYIDIAKITGKTAKSIDNALSRIKKKLEYLKERL